MPAKLIDEALTLALFGKTPDEVDGVRRCQRC
jgi:hypothetical protein